MQFHLDNIISNDALERTWHCGWLLEHYSLNSVREPITTRLDLNSAAPQRYLQRLRHSAFYQAHTRAASPPAAAAAAAAPTAPPAAPPPAAAAAAAAPSFFMLGGVFVGPFVPPATVTRLGDLKILENTIRLPCYERACFWARGVHLAKSIFFVHLPLK